VSATESTLLTHSIPANTLDADGDFLQGETLLTTGATSRARTIRFYWDGVAILTIPLVSGASIQMHLVYRLIRRTSTNLLLEVDYNASAGTPLTTFAGTIASTVFNAAKTFAISVQVTSGVTGDTTHNWSDLQVVSAN
jgi:hypothetical protein